MAINFDEFQSEESTPSSVNFDEFQPIEQKKPISQVITENIKKLAPSMPQEEALKSPFAKYQGPPQAPKPTDILIQPQADPLWEAQQTVKAIAHGALTSPEAFTQQLPYAEGLGERGKPLVPPVLGEITKRIYETAPVRKVLEPVTPEPGMAGQVGEIIGQLGMGAVLSMIPTLARAMRMKPSQVMQQVVAESKATNTPVNDVVKNYLDQYQITGIPSTESQFNVPPKFEGTVTHPATPVTEPQIPPTIPEPIRAKIKQARMKPPKAGEEVPISAFQAPEVKPAEITPTEPKSFRVTPEEVTSQITQLDDMLAQAQKQRRQLALRDKSTAKLDEFIANLERQKASIKPPEVPPVEAKPTVAEPIPPTQPEIRAGVKEAPTVEPTIPTKEVPFSIKTSKPATYSGTLTIEMTVPESTGDYTGIIARSPKYKLTKRKGHNDWNVVRTELRTDPNQPYGWDEFPEKSGLTLKEAKQFAEERLREYHAPGAVPPKPPRLSINIEADQKPFMEAYNRELAQNPGQEKALQAKYNKMWEDYQLGRIEPPTVAPTEWEYGEIEEAKRLINTGETGLIKEGRRRLNLINKDLQAQADRGFTETTHGEHHDNIAELQQAIKEAKSIKPPLQPEAPSVPKVKQPWEMTRGEFLRSTPTSDLTTESYVMAKEPMKVAIKYQDKIYSAKPGTRNIWNHADLIDKNHLPYDKVVPGFVDAQGKFITQYPEYSHKVLVEQALSEGKPVPPEVLKDYPDLKPSLAKRLITEEKGGLTIGGRREELLGKLGEPIELPEKAVNINLKNLDTPDDVKGLITEIGKLYEPEIQEARRGVITNQQTAKLADDLGMSVEDLLKRKPGKAYSAEELLGARRLLTFSGEEALTKAQLAAANPSNENMADALESMFNAIAVQKQVSGATAEAGRALQSAKILAGPEVAREQAMKRIINQMGGQEVTADILKRLGSLDISNPLAVNRFLRDISKATTKEKVYSVWINALLSGLPTHIANDLSNLSSLLIRPFETIAAATYDIPRAAFTGTPRQRFFGEAPADLIGIIQGLPEAGKVFVKSLTTGEPGFIKSTKIDIPQSFLKGKPIKGKLGTAVNAPTSLLQAEDDFFKVLNYRGAVNAYAYREASKQGTGIKGMAKLLSDMPEWLDEAGRAEAVYRTFQKELGKYGKLIMRTRDQLPGGKVVAPFVRTPINIPKFALERTPLNLYGVGKQIRMGGGGAISDELAKMTIGSAIMYIMFKKGLDGTVTGGGPANPGERKAWMMTHQPYSIKVGNRWIGYGRLEPIASIMGIAADLAELVNDWDKIDTNDAVSQVSFAIAKNFTSKTFLTGISDIIKVFDDPTTYGEKWATRLGGTVVPSFVAGITKAIDPTIHRPTNPLEGIEARLPFLSENIPPLRDIWGRPVIMQETGPERFVSPIRRMEIPDDKATSEYVRLGLSASTPAKSFGKIDITSDSYQTYLEQSGEAAHKAVSKIVSRPFYDRLNDMQRSELIKKVMENARKPYRAKMKMEAWRKFKAEGGTMKEFMAESRGYLPESLQTPGGE